ncbi:MAG: class I SAM-dependent methyltransferase [Chryseobacterium sp.]
MNITQKDRIASQCVCCDSTELQKSPAILMPFVAHRVFGWQPVEITTDWELNTIKNGMAYSICNSVFCNNCGHLFLDVRFNDNEMNVLYEGYRDEKYTKLREHYEAGYSKRNEELNVKISYISDIENFIYPHLDFPISVLDWGGDTGKNTPFTHHNKVLHIYYISNKSEIASGAKKVDKSTAMNNKYDLIVCSNVLEHIPYPEEVIFDIKNSMQPDSLLYIEVPLENLIRNNEKTDWIQNKKHWHEHINFYNSDSLSALITKCGLYVVELKELQVTENDKTFFLYLAICKLRK